MRIDPLTDRLVFVRFKDQRIFELVVRNTSGAWIWYEAAFCRRDQMTYLIETEIGEPAVLPMYCDEGELVGVYWADPNLLPESRIDVLAGGPCIRLVQLPTFLRGKNFQAFCASLGFAAEMIPCIYCQDMLPISGDLPEESQQLCEHIRFCPICRMWNSPYFPGKVQVICSARIALQMTCTLQGQTQGKECGSQEEE